MEGVGFEPTDVSVFGLANQRLKPLSHLSILLINDNPF
jgi:hypothetical protein